MNKIHATRSRLLAITTAAALLGLAAGCAAASEPQKSDSTQAPAPVTAAPAMRAYIDPVTGQLRQPTAEELAAQAQATAAASRVEPGKGTAKTVIRADGIVGMTDPKGLIVETVTVTRAADGTLKYSYSGGDIAPTETDLAPAATAEEK